MNVSKDEIMKASIVEEAQKLFQHYGLSKTTMEDIARAIGKGKSALYYYYANKEQILEAVIQKEKQEIFKEIQQALDKVDGAEEKLKTFALTRYEALRQKRNLFNLFRKEASDQMCLIGILKKKYDNIEMSLVRKMVRLGIESGCFEHMDDEKLNAVCVVILANLRSIEFDLIFDDQFSENARFLIATSMEMTIRGLRAA